MKRHAAHLQSGAVIRYPYLWAREAARGETEGRKERPAVVVVRLARNSGDVIVLLAITSKPPSASDVAIEIPDTEKPRAGLDVGIRLWIVLHEANVDVAGKSFYIHPGRPLGTFGRAFFLRVFERFTMALPVRQVDRTR